MNDFLLGSIVSAVSALSGVALTMVANHFDRRAANRRSRREQAVSIALETWRGRNEWAKAMIAKGQPATVPGPEVYVFGMISVLDKLDDGELTPERVKKLTAELHDLGIAAVSNPYEPEQQHK